MIPKTTKELEEVKQECLSMVNKRSSISAVTAIIPIPGVDVGADVLILMQMIDTINKKFGLSETQLSKLDARFKEKIFVIISSLGSELIGRVVTKQIVISLLKKVGIRFTTKQVTKYVPIIGSILSGTISFTAMKYVGKKHIEDCEKVVKKLIEQEKKKE